MAGGRDLALLVGGPDGLDAELLEAGRFPLVALAADLAARPRAGHGRRAALPRAQPAAGTSLSSRLRGFLRLSSRLNGLRPIVLASASPDAASSCARSACARRPSPADIDETPRSPASCRRDYVSAWHGARRRRPSDGWTAAGSAGARRPTRRSSRAARSSASPRMKRIASRCSARWPARRTRC